MRKANLSPLQKVFVFLAALAFALALMMIPGGPGAYNGANHSDRIRWMIFSAGLGIVFFYLAFRMISRQRSEDNSCLRCGYDLTGNSSGTCPECGVPVDRKGQK